MLYAYTDGSSLGNPGPGGYGVVLLSPAHKMRRELSQGYKCTTNNRMELMAVIVALEALKIPNSEITILSDSKYVCESIEKGWIWKWVKTGFKDKKNKDLWLRFIAVYKKHKVKMQWVKGHAGIPENERCDFLATSAAKGPNLLEDEGLHDAPVF